MSLEVDIIVNKWQLLAVDVLMMEKASYDNTRSAQYGNSWQ